MNTLISYQKKFNCKNHMAWILICEMIKEKHLSNNLYTNRQMSENILLPEFLEYNELLKQENFVLALPDGKNIFIIITARNDINEMQQSGSYDLIL
jgi:hypothetical protein